MVARPEFFAWTAQEQLGYPAGYCCCSAVYCVTAPGPFASSST